MATARRRRLGLSGDAEAIAGAASLRPNAAKAGAGQAPATARAPRSREPANARNPDWWGWRELMRPSPRDGDVGARRRCRPYLIPATAVLIPCINPNREGANPSLLWVWFEDLMNFRTWVSDDWGKDYATWFLHPFPRRQAILVLYYYLSNWCFLFYNSEFRLNHLCNFSISSASKQRVGHKKQIKVSAHHEQSVVQKRRHTSDSTLLFAETWSAARTRR